MPVPGYLGCVLHDTGTPAGTCFQIATGVVVTAAHVLGSVGADAEGAVVTLRALYSTAQTSYSTAPTGPGRVMSFDDVHDLAVLTSPCLFPASVSRLCATDDQRLGQPVQITGTADVPHVEHRHEYLDAPGTWAGGTFLHNGTAWGRVYCRDVMPGMSGAPVRRCGDDVVIGIVSGRYNSVDGWLRDSVWVSRTEDLQPLLAGMTALAIRFTPAVPGGAELARLTIDLLSAIDRTLTGAPVDAGDLGQRVEDIVDEVVAGAPDSGAAFRARLRRNGLEPSVLLAWLPQHARAIAQWARDDDGSCSVLLVRLRLRMADAVENGRLPATVATVGHIAAALRGTPAHADYADRLAELVQPARSTVREFVLRETGGVGSPSSRPVSRDFPRSRRAAVELDGRGRRLSHVARHMCTLKRADRYLTGRGRVVATLCAAITDTPDQPVAWISGRPGIGSSEVALHVAHRLATNYDSVLYVDMLSLHAGSRRSARTAARMLIEALGEPLTSELSQDDVIYARLAQTLGSANYLLVLDNARDAGHVAPLVRCGGAGAVIVTSRQRVQTFADAGLAVHLPVLDRRDSIALLAKFVANAQPDDHGHLAHIAELCDDLPLALRLIGGRLTTRPDVPVSELARLLTHEHTRLNYLADEERAVRSAVLLSYHDLDETAQQATRFLSASPGAVSTGPELAYGLTADEAVTSLALHRIVDTSLGECESTRSVHRGHHLAFRLPGLIRLVAGERLVVEDPPDTALEFQRRSTSYLADRLTEIIQSVDNADLELEVDPTRAHAALDLAVAQSWWDIAGDLGRDLRAIYSANWDLPALGEVADALVAVHLANAEPGKAIVVIHDVVEVFGPVEPYQRQALSWARRAEQIAAEHGLVQEHVDSCLLTGRVAAQLDEYRTAFTAMTTAHDLLARHDRADEGLIPLINLAKLVTESADLVDGPRHASWWADRAVDLADRVGEPAARASAHFVKARAASRMGKQAEAIRHYRLAGPLYVSCGETESAAVAAQNTADLFDDDPLGASAAWTEAVRMWRLCDGEQARLAAALVTLTKFQFELGLRAEAGQSLAEAHDACSATEHPQLRHEIAVRLAALRCRQGEAYESPRPSDPPADNLIEDAVRVLALPTRNRAADARLDQLLRQTVINDVKPYEFWLHDTLPARPQSALESTA